MKKLLPLATIAPLALAACAGRPADKAEPPHPQLGKSDALGWLAVERGNLTFEDDRMDRFVDSSFAAYRFAGRQGAEVRIDATSMDGDAVLFLIGPNGFAAFNDDLSSDSTDARVYADLPVDGVYQVYVADFHGAVGDFSVDLDCTSGPCEIACDDSDDCPGVSMCADGGMCEPKTIADACDEKAASICAKRTECFPYDVFTPSDPDVCVEVLGRDCAKTFTREGIVVTPEHLLACRDAFEANISCNDVATNVGFPEYCEPIAGMLPLDAACEVDAQCATGSCERPLVSSQGGGGVTSIKPAPCGTCRPALAEGEACDSREIGAIASCAAGLECDFENGCAANPSWKKDPAPAPGDECATLVDCADPDSTEIIGCYADSTGAKACQPFKGVGESCTAFGECDYYGQGLGCDQDTGTCQPLGAALGEACGVLIASVTDPDGTVHQTFKTQDCSIDLFCQFADPADQAGVCVAQLGAGAACSESITWGPQCADPLVCSEGQCQDFDSIAPLLCPQANDGLSLACGGQPNIPCGAGEECISEYFADFDFGSCSACIEVPSCTVPQVPGPPNIVAIGGDDEPLCFTRDFESCNAFLAQPGETVDVVIARSGTLEEIDGWSVTASACGEARACWFGSFGAEPGDYVVTFESSSSSARGEFTIASP
jgi:hypothetical protein